MDATDFAFAGLARQAELLRAREVSAPELTELCLSRIDALNPRLNAFRVVLGERAAAEAARAQERHRDSRLGHAKPVGAGTLARGIERREHRRGASGARWYDGALPA